MDGRKPLVDIRLKPSGIRRTSTGLGASHSNSKTAKRAWSTSSNIIEETTMAHAAKRNPDRCPTHPGALLREDVIPATGRTKAEIARLLGISRQHLYDILRERKPVSPAVAVRLGKLFGAGVWVRMQAAYDTWHAERDEDVSKIPTLGARAA
jgi:addiction module HigA family antidote